jgi:hypothetical protein
LARVFEERGVPGATEAGNRPAWVEMLATILDNGVRTIIIEKLDRLARDLIVQEHIIADLYTPDTPGKPRKPRDLKPTARDELGLSRVQIFIELPMAR